MKLKKWSKFFCSCLIIRQCSSKRIITLVQSAFLTKIAYKYREMGSYDSEEFLCFSILNSSNSR